MKINLSYVELEHLIENKSGKKVTIDYVDEKTIRLSYHIKVMMFEKEIAVELRVTEIDGYVVKVAFVDEEIMQLAVGAVHHIIPFDFISIDQSNCFILVDTAKIKECEEVYNHVSLDDICFEDDALVLHMNLFSCNLK